MSVHVAFEIEATFETRVTQLAGVGLPVAGGLRLGCIRSG